MKKYKLVVDYDNEDYEEIETLHDKEMDRAWLDIGSKTLELPKELLPYLAEADELGIA